MCRYTTHPEGRWRIRRHMFGRFVGRHTSCHKHSLWAPSCRSAGGRGRGRGGSPPHRPHRNLGPGEASARQGSKGGRAVLVPLRRRATRITLEGMDLSRPADEGSRKGKARRFQPSPADKLRPSFSLTSIGETKWARATVN
jgi:hypothetical protein